MGKTDHCIECPCRSCAADHPNIIKAAWKRVEEAWSLKRAPFAEVIKSICKLIDARRAALAAGYLEVWAKPCSECYQIGYVNRDGLVLCCDACNGRGWVP